MPYGSILTGGIREGKRRKGGKEMPEYRTEKKGMMNGEFFWFIVRFCLRWFAI
jgi:hypothetical protein